MSSASVTLGAAVGGAFALLIVVIVVAYCIYMYRHPERHKLAKVQPDKNVKTGESPEVNWQSGSICCCWDKSLSKTVPLPDPPVKLELKDLQYDDVTIAWNHPVTDAAARIDHYVIYLRPSAKLNDWTKVAKVKNDVTEKLIQKLEPTERYVIGVASKNKGGESPIIETKPFILGKEIGPPSPPMRPLKYYEVTTNSVGLSWKRPRDDGNSPILNYLVEILDPRDNEWREVGVTEEHLTIFSVVNLSSDTDFRFRVTARNAKGAGAPLVGGVTRTHRPDKSPLGSKPSSSRSRYSTSHSGYSSNTKLSKSAIQNILTRWENGTVQIAPKSTRTTLSKTPKVDSNKTAQIKNGSTTGLRSEPRIDTSDQLQTSNGVTIP